VEVCKICGEPVDILTHVHCEKHGLTKEEYRKKYGDNEKRNFSFTKNKLWRDECDKYEANRLRRCY
jgi:hypothetical protein